MASTNDKGSISKSTIARMAGNIAAGLAAGHTGWRAEDYAKNAVRIAKAIINEVERDDAEGTR